MLYEKFLLLQLQPLCYPSHSRFSSQSDAFANSFFLFQMADLPPRQIVRLTRCIGVRGHTTMLIEMMFFVGYRWYLEYTSRRSSATLSILSTTASSGSTRTTLESLNLSSSGM